MTTTSAPRGPRSPITRESGASGVVEAHGALEISDGPAPEAPPVPVVSLDREYDGRVMTCRKPFKLNGEKYSIGDDVPVDLIPRPESWIRTGFLKEAS